MKYIFIFLTTCILFFGCSKKTDETKTGGADKFAVDTAGLKTESVNNPNEAFNLTYKFDKDKQYKYKLTSYVHDVQTLKTDSAINKKLERTLVYMLNARQVDEGKDGTKDMNCEITSVKLSEDVNGKKIEFESGAKMDSNQISQFTEFYALLNNPFGVKINSNGGIVEISRVDKIVDRYVHARSSQVKLSDDQKERLKSGLIESILKPIVAQVFRAMPDKSVAKDSSWSVQQPPARFLIFDVKNSDDYKIESLRLYNSDKLAVIHAGMSSNIEGKQNLVQNGITYNFNKPETSTSGEIYFNISKGCIQKSKIKTTTHIFFTMEGMTPKGKEKRSEEENVLSSNVVELL